MNFELRAARPTDAEVLGRLAGVLVRHHHALDPERFPLMEDPPEPGYRDFLLMRMEEPEAVVLVAEEQETGRVLGYAYGRMEPRIWDMLLDAAGWIHDVAVEPDARGRGIGEALLRAVIEALEAMGAPRIVLNTAARNEDAQRLFAKLGFEVAMVQMMKKRAGKRAEERA